jgi:hypothetical protein
VALQGLAREEIKNIIIIEIGKSGSSFDEEKRSSTIGVRENGSVDGVWGKEIRISDESSPGFANAPKSE